MWTFLVLLLTICLVNMQPHYGQARTTTAQTWGPPFRRVCIADMSHWHIWLFINEQDQHAPIIVDECTYNSRWNGMTIIINTIWVAILFHKCFVSISTVWRSFWKKCSAKSKIEKHLERRGKTQIEKYMRHSSISTLKIVHLCVN